MTPLMKPPGFRLDRRNTAQDVPEGSIGTRKNGGAPNQRCPTTDVITVIVAGNCSANGAR